jgi:hypothetical protein
MVRYRRKALHRRRTEPRPQPIQQSRVRCCVASIPRKKLRMGGRQRTQPFTAQGDSPHWCRQREPVQALTQQDQPVLRVPRWGRRPEDEPRGRPVGMLQAPV